MKIKLIEAAQPIDKLQYNIEKNILPAFGEYGYIFNSSPLRINEYVYVYRGTCEHGFVSLRLNTASKEIDQYNETKDPEDYTGDLFAKVVINGEEDNLGVLSSKEPESVDDVMVEFDSENYRLPTENEIQTNKLIPPKTPNDTYGPMTADKWRKLKDDLVAETDKLRDILKDYQAKYSNEELEYNDEYKNVEQKLKEKADYLYNKFYKKIYPFNEIE